MNLRKWRFDWRSGLHKVQALDRVLTSGRYVIPFWYSNVSHIAHKRELKHPDYVQVYGDWLGFLPDVWWYQN